MVANGLAEGFQGEEGFWGKGSRRWMRGFLVPEEEGDFMIDIVRKLWPERKGMHTCLWCFFYVAFLGIGLTCQILGWNTKISARDANYGARIDYILIRVYIY
jgi:AP endonuclease-2